MATKTNAPVRVLIYIYMPEASEKIQDDFSLNISNGDLDLDTGLNGDGSDLLDHFRGTVQIDHALVHTQLEPVPGVGT